MVVVVVVVIVVVVVEVVLEVVVVLVLVVVVVVAVVVVAAVVAAAAAIAIIAITGAKNTIHKLDKVMCRRPGVDRTSFAVAAVVDPAPAARHGHAERKASWPLATGHWVSENGCSACNSAKTTAWGTTENKYGVAR